jgi:cytochrome c-type biogenesis protein CcmH
MTRCIAVLAVALIASIAWATKMEPPPAAGDALDARLKKLETELRCLVCQNQTLADSNADLADDLRREVKALALAGKSDDEIKTYLVARYGDFVLYNPPVKAVTWLLWFGPFAMMIGGGAVWWIVLRRRARSVTPASASNDGEAQARARALLDEDDDRER